MKGWPPLAFVFFSVAFVVVGALPHATLTCPICLGTGTLKAAPGLKVNSITSTLISAKSVFTFGNCGMPVTNTEFSYAVNMSLSNPGTEASQGTVSVVFNRHAAGEQVFIPNLEGELVATEYVPPTLAAYVVIPAGTTKNVPVVITFVDTPILPGDPSYRVTVTAGADMADPTCGGTGKLDFIKWLEVKLKPPSSL